MTFLPFPTDQGRSCISSATAFVAHLICEPAELVLLISAHGRINTDQVHMCNCSKKIFPEFWASIKSCSLSFAL